MNKFSVIFKLSFINTIFFYLPVLANNSPVDYVNTLAGTQSKFETVHRKYLSSYCNSVGYELLDYRKRRYGRTVGHIHIMPTK